MVQAAEQSSDVSITEGKRSYLDREGRGQKKRYLSQGERRGLVQQLSQEEYSSELVPNPNYDPEKLEHNIEVVNKALEDLHNTTLEFLSPRDTSLTLIRLNLAGVDLNVCPHYEIDTYRGNEETKTSEGNGPQILAKKCSEDGSYQLPTDANNCNVQIVDKLCPVLTRKGEKEGKSWEDIIADLNQQNQQLRQEYDGIQISDS